ncbi:hemerythrin domain-containing protein [Nocardioides iriomotensis]|nr:hemerythrin domain-containing protein [Nocardioides iriomotensis]
MAEQLTMNRVIHAAVRRDLTRLDAALGAVADGDTARAQQLQRAYAALHEQLSHHHRQEDTYIFPTLERLGLDPTLVAEMDSEHHKMAEALDETATVMRRYAASASAADAGSALASVRSTTQVVERHLAHEEAELEPLMEPYLEDPTFKQAEKDLRKGPVTQSGVFFAWLTDGMEPHVESSLKSYVPGPVVLVLSKVFGRRYYREVAPAWKV